MADTNAIVDEGTWVFVFNGQVGDTIWQTFPAAVFSSKERADAWIAKHRLTGILTRYPLDKGVYEWTIERGYFTPKRDEQRTPSFIGRFSSAHTDHWHYEDGA